MRETTDATSIFAPIWRRKWLILLIGIVVGAASYFYYKHAERTFSASTQVFVGSSSEEANPSEKSTKVSGSESANQAAIINSIVVPEVRTALHAEGLERLAKGAKVKAKTPEKGQFIIISAEGHTAKGTVLLVNRTAQAYIKRKNSARERSIKRSISLTRRQLERLEAAGAPSESGGKTSKSSTSTSKVLQAASLSTKLNALEASLAMTGVEQVQPATRATLVAPSPRKDAIFGFVIAVVLASIAAYAIGRLDRQLRTLEGIESLFPAPILTVLPQVGRPIVRGDGQTRPSRLLLEPLRRLHTSLELGGPSGNGAGPGGARQRARTLLFLSPDPGDGKSTLVADLALVQRDGGARVAVVEANFRRPTLARMLGLSGAHGLAEVLAGTIPVAEAWERVLPAPGPAEDLDGPAGAPAAAGAATAVASERGAGALFLLAGSESVPNPPALLAQSALGDTLKSLAEDFDYVLIDAPSPLEFSDVMPLMRMVDGLVLVARAGHTRELSAQRLLALLDHEPTAPIAGTVVNCVSKGDIRRHGLAAARGQTWLGRLTGG